MLKLEIVKYDEIHIPAVKEFNRRLREGGSRYQFPESPIPKWLPKIEGRRLFQEFFLAVEGDIVHGGYILKHQDFYIVGKDLNIACYQLPLSEGEVDKRFRGMGKILSGNALKRKQHLFALGMGGLQSPAAKSLIRTGWALHSIPFYFKITHPFNFLRNIQYLRKSAVKKIFLDFLAFSGIGWIGLKIFGMGKSGPGLLISEIKYAEIEAFEDWADELWNRCKDSYVFAGIRDRKILNILYPSSDSRFIRLIVKHQGEIVGWVVMLATAMSGHKYFGNMKVGSIIDCLAMPGFEKHVIMAAEKTLRMRNADIMVSNQGNTSWCEALRGNGFINGPSNFALALSPQLGEMLEPLGRNLNLIHINRGDGGGPINL